jgi:ABC-type glycerol-3-phosphate transport system permease component
MHSDSVQRKTLLLGIWIVLAFIYLFPYTWMVLTGFRQPIDTLTMPPHFLFSPTLDGFRYLFQTSQFQFYLLNSLIVALSSTLAVILVAAPAAYALAHLPFSGRAFLLLIIIARMIPAITIVIPAYLIATKLGQLDTYQILVLIYVAFNLPFAIWLTRSFFREIHPSIREAAIIDGCNEFQVFRHIMLPLTSSGIVATGVFVFIAAWNEFLFALILTSSNAATAPLAMLGFRTQWGVLWGQIGAAAFLVSTPVLVFTVAMQKYLIRGLTMGSVK